MSEQEKIYHEIMEMVQEEYGDDVKVDETI